MTDRFGLGRGPSARTLPAAGRAGCVAALLVLACLAGCRTAGTIVQSSTDFRLQNIEAALVKIQGEVQALEARQAEGDKTWGEVRTKLDELAQLVRARAGEPGVASVPEAPPPWAGQPLAAAASPASSSAPSAASSAVDRPPRPFGASGRTASAAGQGDGASSLPPAELGRPFPGTPPGQTAKAVQDAAAAQPAPSAFPPSAPEVPAAAPPSPAAELASASAPAPVSAASPGGNPAKTWELPGPDAATAPTPVQAAPPPAASSAPPSSLSPYPAMLPPAGEAAATAAAPAAAAPAGRVPTAPPPASAPGRPSPGEEADYNRALKLALNGKPREAKAAFNDFLARHPQSALEPNVRYWIGESEYIQGEMEQAARSFTDVSKRFVGHHKAADSLYKLGMVQERLGNAAAARAAYESLAKDYPSSELVGNAKRKLEQLPR